MTEISEVRASEDEKLWGGETDKAVANFPVSGHPIPAPVVHWLGRIKAAAARTNAELGLLDSAHAERIAAAGDAVGTGRARRPVPRRRVPDRLRHLVEHERQRGDRQPRRRRRPPQRSRQHGPVVQRRLSLGGPSRRPRRGDERPAPRPRGAGRRPRREGRGVRRPRQVGAHPPDGRRARSRSARSSRASPRRSASARRASGRRWRTSAGSRSAAPPPAPGSTPTPTSPPASARSSPPTPAWRSRRRTTASRRRPTATRSSSCPAPSRSSPSR